MLKASNDFLVSQAFYFILTSRRDYVRIQTYSCSSVGSENVVPGRNANRSAARSLDVGVGASASSGSGAYSANQKG